MTLTTPKKIIDFWLNEVGPAGGGYEADQEIYQQIITRFTSPMMQQLMDA